MPVDADANELLEEVGSKCPLKGCGLHLRPVENGQVRIHYGFALVGVEKGYDDTGPAAGYIAVCAEHYKQFTQGLMTGGERTTLRLTKAILAMRRCAHNKLFGMNMYDGFLEVLEAFGKKRLKQSGSAPLSQADIAKKFTEENALLLSSVEHVIAENAVLIDSVLTDYERVTKGFEKDALWTRVHDAYLEIKRGGSDQNWIFEEITDWFFDQTKADKILCRIVASFYIQNCAIFEELKNNVTDGSEAEQDETAAKEPEVSTETEEK